MGTVPVLHAIADTTCNEADGECGGDDSFAAVQKEIRAVQSQRVADACTVDNTPVAQFNPCMTSYCPTWPYPLASEACTCMNGCDSSSSQTETCCSAQDNCGGVAVSGWFQCCGNC